MPWPKPTSPPAPAPPESPEELIFKRRDDGIHIESPWWPVVRIAGPMIRQELGGLMRRTEKNPNVIRIKPVNGVAFYAVDSYRDDIYRCHLLYGE